MLAESLREEGRDVRFVPIDPPFPRGARWLRRVPYARTILNESIYQVRLLDLRRSDVVHVFSAAYWSFVLSALPAVVAARALGKPVVLNYHSGEAEDHLRRWNGRIQRWLALADRIVVPSQYLRAVFERHGIEVRVIPNAVNTTHFRFRERRPLLPHLLSARNLEPHYRVERTLEAYGVLRQRRPDATLTIAGAGSEEVRLRRLAARLGGGIRFVGAVEPRRMGELYERHDIFVNASSVDNQPLSVLEAFASGLPVVSTIPGDLASMVRDGETGLAVPSGSPEAMAGAVASLLEDPEGARRMARRARKEAERHAWGRVGKAWLDLYEELAA
jgi:glycosyltransferase involved in cell wall biosynthesis